ncbi:MAG: hypothetical protein IKP81_12145 [Paludibacteraceae bacterium]|nr:hypothetical protein [Paludibacteraceae bacterium]
MAYIFFPDRSMGHFCPEGSEVVANHCPPTTNEETYFIHAKVAPHSSGAAFFGVYTCQ